MKNDQILNPYKEIKTPEEYAQWRSTLAKRANTRLRALEKATSKVTGETYTFGAYEHFAAKVLKMDRPRWSESKKPKDINVMRKEITQLQTFLKAPSSTVSGSREIERRRIETFESGEWGRKSFDADGKEIQRKRKSIKAASNKEFYDFLNSGLLTEKLNPYFSSERMVDLYERAYENGLSHDEITDKFFAAFEDFKAKRKSASIENIEKDLGLNWI